MSTHADSPLETSDPADADQRLASEEQVFTGAVTSVEQALEQLRELYATSHGNPETWPRLAAELQTFGTRLAQHGANLAELLASHAQQWPHVEVPASGPCVLLLDPDQHTNLWVQASDAVADGVAGPDIVTAYAAAAFFDFGRSDLEYTVEHLDSISDQAVAVLMHLPGRPEDVVRIVVGGAQHPDDDTTRDALAALFDERGITPGMPTFYAPPAEHDVPLTTTSGELHDQYGRLIPPVGDRP